MSKNIIGKKTVEICLPYFKRGDDLDSCIVKDDKGKIDTKETLRNHISLLESAIEILKAINLKIPITNDMEIYGDTHYISLTGDERIINELLNADLVQEEPLFDDELSDENIDIEGKSVV